jgi:hypothetical protein
MEVGLIPPPAMFSSNEQPETIVEEPLQPLGSSNSIYTTEPINFAEYYDGIEPFYNIVVFFSIS